jgi:hypothetical protein
MWVQIYCVHTISQLMLQDSSFELLQPNNKAWYYKVLVFNKHLYTKQDRVCITVQLFYLECFKIKVQLFN